MYSLSAWARREREARIYDMWPWSASVKPIATCSDFSRSRKVFTDEQPPWKDLCLCQMQMKNLLKQLENALICTTTPVWLEYRPKFITNTLYCMNSLSNSTGTQTLKTGVARQLTHSIFLGTLKIKYFQLQNNVNFSSYVFPTMLVTVLLLLQKSTIKVLCHYRWLYTLLLFMYTCTFYTSSDLTTYR